MGKVMAIVNQKGGVGKSTTAVMLAKSLASYGKHVLLVLLDPLSCRNYQMQVKEHGRTNNWMGPQAVLADYLYPTDGMDVIPCCKELVGFEITAINQPRREFTLADKLEPLKSQYDYILIDAPSSLGLLVMNAMVAADELLIPIRCEYFIFEGMPELLRIISDVREKLNRKLNVGGFVITHVNQELKSTEINIRDIRLCYGEKVLKTEIPESNQMAESYKELAKEIMASDKRR